MEFLFWGWVTANAVGVLVLAWLLGPQACWRVRRAWRKVFRYTLTDGECADCGAALTQEERTYYGHSCEWCEGEWMRRIESADRPEGQLKERT